MAQDVGHDEVPDGIGSRIEAVERQILQLRIEFSMLLVAGASANRMAILQQLSMLQARLKLLKIRRMYASEVRS